MQLFHFRNVLFSTPGYFVSHHCSIPLRLAFNVIWSFRTAQKLALAYDHPGRFLRFGVERGSLNLLNSADLFVYFAEVRLPASF